MTLYAPETAPGGRGANPDLSHGRESQTESASIQGKPSDHLPLHQSQKRISLPNQTVQSHPTLCQPRQYHVKPNEGRISMVDIDRQRPSSSQLIIVFL